MSVRITAMSDHHHDHDEHQHAGHEHGAQAHHHHADAGTRLIWALLLTLAIAAVEELTGFWSGSLASPRCTTCISGPCLLGGLPCRRI